jgi:hypothetical protein
MGVLVCISCGYIENTAWGASAGNGKPRQDGKAGKCHGKFP